MEIVKLTSENFEEETKGNGTVLIDFYADWCGPCRMMAPVIEEIATERTDVKVCKLNVDEAPDIASSFGVMSIPTLVVLHDGKVSDTRIGVHPKDEVLSLL